MTSIDSRPHAVAEAGPRRRRRRGRVALLVVIGLAAVPLIAAALQATLEWRDARRYPAPGERVDVGGFALHLQVSAEARTGPAVILEAGGGSYSDQWGWVQPAVAEFALVVSHDRPGLGWSDRAPEPLDGTLIAEYLRTALTHLGVDPPYVYVGHSVGGPLGRAFAQRFPSDVAGMVMVDPRVFRTEDVLGDIAIRQGENMKRWLPVAARLGVPRLLNPAAGLAGELPEPQRSRGLAFFAATSHLSGMATEWDMGNRTTDRLAATDENYGDMPIIVLSSGQPDAAFDETARARFTEAQRSLTAFSSQAEHRIVPGADHYTIVTAPAYAAEVVRAIRDVIERLAEGGDGT